MARTEPYLVTFLFGFLRTEREKEREEESFGIWFVTVGAFYLARRWLYIGLGSFKKICKFFVRRN